MARQASHGFTLVELLVALAILSVMALMSWQGVDAMLRSDEALQAQAREVRVLDVALSQWHTDLDAIVQLPSLPSMAWDGRVLRLVRRDADNAGAGVTVVAWSVREVDARLRWIRWQAPGLRTQGQVRRAWEQAAIADTAATQGLPAEAQAWTALLPVTGWQLAFFEDGRWGDTFTPRSQGLRLMLAMSAGPGGSGVLTLDWVDPRVTGHAP